MPALNTPWDIISRYQTGGTAALEGNWWSTNGLTDALDVQNIWVQVALWAGKNKALDLFDLSLELTPPALKGYVAAQSVDQEGMVERILRTNSALAPAMLAAAAGRGRTDLFSLLLKGPLENKEWAHTLEGSVGDSVRNKLTNVARVLLGKYCPQCGLGCTQHPLEWVTQPSATLARKMLGMVHTTREAEFVAALAILQHHPVARSADGDIQQVWASVAMLAGSKKWGDVVDTLATHFSCDKEMMTKGMEKCAMETSTLMAAKFIAQADTHTALGNLKAKKLNAHSYAQLEQACNDWVKGRLTQAIEGNGLVASKRKM